ncbi:MAG TPA: adenylate/guanylate cyclase domain-containing protein [Actinomycetota bacterium]|nr:adenylate/guanylate cyclase domain-containing protein [Actinomycetota bacterium]
MRCPTCGTENPAGRKFCGQCGTPLALPCPTCGTPNEPRFKFCGECGASLGGAPPTPTPAAARPVPAAERRVVTVLFADLVGFTALSEDRDPEEVRDLLTRYFDRCRETVTRYGGTVEKFIGDAVMAVWGTPVAREDDPERAVRAALDLVEAVAELGREVGSPELRARAGVMTGEAAVTPGAEGQGMVAGDLVNTASRVQALAEPGTVVVGEATRRATEAAIVFEPAGTHRLRGRAEPVTLYRALRVIGGVGGALRSTGLEAPFVGRDRELRLVKDLFHATVEGRRAHLLQVVGIAGIGKSRLAWELYKYLDGLADVFLWHRGRCLAYGEGVTYWALAEMVRGRCGILEGEDAATAASKLRATVAEFVPDADERAFVEPRLAHLLGLEERAVREPEDLFSGWRRFFERLADRHPVEMVFEDMQWADRSLLDFLDYLLSWSRDHPIFVMALARPEVAERHPDWVAPRRGATTLHLEPLPDEAMRELLTGLIPDLPGELERRILERAEGVPLYAVETVRMLLDRGLLEPQGAAYRLTGPVEALEVPVTLQALIAARLDGLEPLERLVLQDASVLGKTFTPAALAAVSGTPEPELEPVLASLVRKEVLFVQADPRSPERGQYGFLQDLVRRVAYERLSRRERKARHLAAAAHLEGSWGGEEVEVVEVLASHYLEAYQLDPAAPDAAAIKGRAREALIAAGRRSESLAAAGLAHGYYLKAIELADDPVARAELHERAGLTLVTLARTTEARAHLEEAIATFEREGRPREAARVAARLSDVAFGDGRLDEAVERMEQAFAALSSEEPDETLATAAAQLARMLIFSGRTDEAFQRNEVALELAEGLELPEVFSHALNTKGVWLEWRGRYREGLALMRHALHVALEHERFWAALRAYNNLMSLMFDMDRLEEALQLSGEALELARKVGYRSFELSFMLGRAGLQGQLGRWDEALDGLAEFEAEARDEARSEFLAVDLADFVPIFLGRGDLEGARRILGQMAHLEESDELQARSSYAWTRALVERAEGNLEQALAFADRAAAARSPHLGLNLLPVKASIVLAIETLLGLGRLEEAERRLADLEAMRPGELSPFLRGQRSRLRARLLAARGQEEGVERAFQVAELEFHRMPWPFGLAVTLLEHGEWLLGQRRTQEAARALTEAREAFERLEARPWVERAGALLGRLRAVTQTAPG